MENSTEQASKGILKTSNILHSEKIKGGHRIRCVTLYPLLPSMPPLGTHAMILIPAKGRMLMAPPFPSPSSHVALLYTCQHTEVSLYMSSLLLRMHSGALHSPIVRVRTRHQTFGGPLGDPLRIGRT